MSRYIDADALIETLNDYGVPYYADIDYFIERAPTIDQPSSEWIPCSERLPKEGERILVTAALEHVMVAHYGKMFFEKERGNVFYLAGEDGDADITDVVVAWMPLPEPYREEVD